MNIFVFFLNVFILVGLSSCALPERRAAQSIAPSQERFFLSDRSGKFVVSRTITRKGEKLVLKKEVYSPGEMNIPLEKTVAVADLGKMKTKKGIAPSLRPNVVQYTIWYDKERFFSQLKINPATKNLDVIMQSPEKRWNGKRSYPFPKGRVFCFFSQLPECVKAHGLLDNRSTPTEIQVIWDNYPYHQEMYEKVSSDPFEKGVWAFDKNLNDGTRFGLVVGGQLVLYQFDVDQNFTGMFWVAQGITLSNKE